MATTNAAPTVAGDEPYTPIPMTAVASKQVKSIGYDPATKTLAITFTRGSESVYHYPNVEPEMYASLVAAESVGMFFSKHIKSLPFKKFTAPQGEPS